MVLHCLSIPCRLKRAFVVNGYVGSGFLSHLCFNLSDFVSFLLAYILKFQVRIHSLLKKEKGENIQKGGKDRKLKSKRKSKKRTPLLKIVVKVSLLNNFKVFLMLFLRMYCLS